LKEDDDIRHLEYIASPSTIWYRLPPSYSDHIYLPHLRYAEAIPSDEYLRGAERAMAILHHEHCNIVRNIVVSLERLGCTLLEGDTMFGSLKTVQLTCAVVLLYAYDLKFT